MTFYTDLADGLLSRGLKDGGLTLLPGASLGDPWVEPTQGYVVGGLGRETYIQIEDGRIPPSEVHMARAWVLLSLNALQPGQGLGSWQDGDGIVLDVVEVFEDRPIAIEAARARLQDAIYDLANRETIWLSDGGIS